MMMALHQNKRNNHHLKRLSKHPKKNPKNKSLKKNKNLIKIKMTKSQKQKCSKNLNLSNKLLNKTLTLIYEQFFSIIKHFFMNLTN